MPAIKYRVTLTDDEVEMLEAMLRKGKCAARKQTRARILLKAAAGCEGCGDYRSPGRVRHHDPPYPAKMCRRRRRSRVER